MLAYLIGFGYFGPRLANLFWRGREKKASELEEKRKVCQVIGVRLRPRLLTYAPVRSFALWIRPNASFFAHFARPTALWRPAREQTAGANAKIIRAKAAAASK